MGVVRGESGWILIDSGLDRQGAKKARRMILERGGQIKHIINTHSHADHFGGNRFWSETEEEGIQVWAPPLEEAIIRYPELEPIYLFNGVRPPRELLNKFLCAEPSRVDHVISDPAFTVDGVDFSVLSLPGHSYRQIGLVVDDVCFAADSYFGQDVLKKHKIPYLVDAGETLDSLQLLKSTSFSAYVPGHGPVEKDVQETLDINIRCHEDLLSQILRIIKQEEGSSLEEICALLFSSMEIVPERLASYLLYQTAVLGYIRHLWESGAISYRFDRHRLVWVALSAEAEK